MSKARGIEIVFHQRSNEYAPENTYAAAKLCLSWGIDYLEVDVNTSKDGVLYLIHDPDVDRTTDGRGLVTRLTSDDIDRLDAGSRFDPKFSGERVPRLEPFLRWIKGRVKIYFDVKAADPEVLIDAVYRVGMENDCFFWSSDLSWLAQLKRIDPKTTIKTNVRNTNEVQKMRELYGTDIVEVGLRNMSKELVNSCRSLGIKIMIHHGERDAEAFKKVLEWNVDMILCNHPLLFAEVASEIKGS